MAWFKNIGFTATLLFVLFLFSKGEHNSKYDPDVRTCRMLNEKFIITTPWSSTPIVFEPIVRGRLTIWAGVSSQTDGGFNCRPASKDEATLSSKNTSEIILEFSNYSNKLEWTFYDLNKGSTYMGISVNHRDKSMYKITVANRQLDSYLDCNVIEKIEIINNDTPISIQTSCLECNQPMITIIESQLREVFKIKLEEHIVENLYWQVSQILSNQHFSHPLPLLENKLD